MPKLPFYFGQMIVSNGLIAFCPLCRGSFLGTPRTSKSFKLSTFWLLDLASGSRGWLKQKGIFFLGKRIVTLSPVVPIKLAPLSTSRPIVSRSCLLIFPATINLFQLLAASLILRSMAEGPSRDPTIANPPTNEDTGATLWAESIAAMTSSPTCGTTLMAKGEIPKLSKLLQEDVRH
jgi:hypothetical protein